MNRTQPAARCPNVGKALLLSCIDDRLVAPDTVFVAELGGAFMARTAGGTYGAARHPAWLAEQVVTAWQVNQITDVYLQSHTDCGFYAAHAPNPAVGLESQVAELYEVIDTVIVELTAAIAALGVPADAIAYHARVVDPNGGIEPRAVGQSRPH